MPKEHQPEKIINQRYRITHILGKGGVGITYSAIDLETNSTVAIKAISLKKLKDWKQVELFEREARVLAKLDHPAIPKYLDYFDLESEKDKVFYIVQQQAPGKSLFQLVESGWRTTEKEVRQIAEQILSILTYLHSQDPPVIHRDIKPHNLIRSDDGKIFLVDFGAVQNTYYDTLMQGSTVVGTYGYMAPEQFRGKAEPATDLYSLGATILYLLTHRSPSELPQNTLKLDFRSQVNISDSFADWLDKILEPDIEDRFNSAKNALSTLHKKKPVTNKRDTSRKLAAILIFALLGTGIFKLNNYKFDILLKSEYYQKKICNNSKFAKEYINQGKDINANLRFDKNIQSFLSCLTGTKDSELIKLLETNKFKIIDIKLYDKIMFIWAISNSQSDVLKQMISKNKVDISFRYNKRRYKRYNIFLYYSNSYFCPYSTPLYEAIIKRDYQLVELLIDNHADINDNCEIKRLGNINYINQDAIINPLSQAIYERNIEIVELLLSQGAKTDFNLIPVTLASAVYRNNYELLKVLLDHGLNPTTNNLFIRTERLSEIDPNYIQGTRRTRVVKYNSLLHFAKARQRYEIVGLFNQYADHNNKINNK